MEQRKKKRFNASYIASTISISFVLFLFGAMVFLILNAREISRYVSENIGFSIVIKDNVKPVDVKYFQKTLKTKKYVKESKYINKKEAAQDFRKEVGVDFVEFLGYNPLLPSIDLKIDSKFIDIKNLKKIEKEIRKSSIVHDVYYQKSLVSTVNRNVKKISFILIGIGFLMLLISFTLIRNTLHLVIYSKRFIINTMQLVGAKNSFIRLPFLINSIWQGIISALFAIIILIICIYFTYEQFSVIKSLLNIDILAIMSVSILVMGIILSYISTLLSVNKFLNKDINELYS
ncbi:MAG: permease-like cell division protein FtsX [Marinifilaceae bacterium]|jgi:cell division transport system permease protein|nr:permease-like cell division protein FtsX [Marinifilaceae bacterium]